MEKFQLAVIGAGPGGYVAAIRAAQLGFTVACVDKMAPLGGTCLNVGCIPSKALLQSSEAYDWIAKSSREQGVAVQGVSFDLATMMKRKEAIVKQLVEGISAQFKKRGITRLEGEARFLNPHEMEVGGKRFEADAFLIATGSEPIALPFLPFDEKRVVSSTGALSLESVPKKMVVIGGGAIGVELASVYRRLGAEVAIIEMMEMIVPNMDAALGKQLFLALKKQGMEFFLGAKVQSAKNHDNGLELAITHEGKNLSIAADVALVSVGRKPYVQGLCLEAAGVLHNPQGFISVDESFRTSQPHIFAIGDVIGGAMLAHKASHEGIAVAELLAGLQPSVNYMSIPNVVYTHPEVASVGLSEAEAISAGFKLLTGTAHFKGNPRARCAGDLEGFVKVVGNAKGGRLLGMHIIGGDASELISEGVVAMVKRATLADLAYACHPHPTLSEAIMEACQQALGFAIHG